MGAAPFFQRGWASIANRSLNMFTLVGLGIAVAYLYSAAATVAPGIFRTAAAGVSAAVALYYFESAAAITTLVLLGQVLELRGPAAHGSGAAHAAGAGPSDRTPPDENGAEHDVPLEAVAVGDRLRVRPGEKLPVDGWSRPGAAASTRRWLPVKGSRCQSSPARPSSVVP